MNTCFDNYIGVLRPDADCAEPPPAPRSGLYLQDLEGISLNMAASITDPTEPGLAMLRRKMEFAYGLVLDDFRQYAMPYLRMNSVVDQVDAGAVSADFLAPSDLQRGIEIRSHQLGARKLKIAAVSLLAAQSGEATLQVIDSTWGVTKLVTLSAGVPLEVVLDYEVKTPLARIVLSQDLGVNAGSLKARGGCSGCGSGGRATGDYWGYTAGEGPNFSYGSFAGQPRNSYSKGGAYGDTSTYRTGASSNRGPEYSNTRGKNTPIEVRGWNGVSHEDRNFGVRALMMTECDYEGVFCLLLGQLKYVMLYRAGVEVMHEWLASERLNEFTTLHEDHAAHLSTRWQTEYDKKFKALAASLRPLLSSIDDVCITCRGTQYAYSY